MTLLIHSMSEFAELILPMLGAAGARSIVEIGAEYGGMTTRLADYTAGCGGTLTTIDPAPKPAFRDWLAGQPHVRHIARPSPAALDAVGEVDAWLIDGDHNWYTVFHEFQAIDAIAARDGKPLLVFLHDVGWPCARRDQYYAPAAIPPEFRHPHCFESGTRPGENALAHGRGFRGMGAFAYALHEGGPKNGVKTAIEDFTTAKLAAGVDLAYAEVPAVFGLGVIFALDAPWSGRLADMVVPFHHNRLIAALEANRLANYLAVLDWQDGAVDAA